MNLNLSRNPRPASEAERFDDVRTAPARTPAASAKVCSRHPLVRACIAFLIGALASMAAAAAACHVLPPTVAGR